MADTTFKRMVMDSIKDAANQQMRDINKGIEELVSSDAFKEQIATAINKKIDIPFVDEKKEQIFFEKCVELVTDTLRNIFKY
tara:strand:+ start:102 stop:347 length:246 start_codon:yes stop_codon:yes gene_type:complete